MNPQRENLISELEGMQFAKDNAVEVLLDWARSKVFEGNHSTDILAALNFAVVAFPQLVIDERSLKKHVDSQAVGSHDELETEKTTQLQREIDALSLQNTKLSSQDKQVTALLKKIDTLELEVGQKESELSELNLGLAKLGSIEGQIA